MSGISSHAAPRCIAILGGSFDPVHLGHVALAEHFVGLLQPDELRVIPAGNPWQKHGLQATAQQRVAMVKLAFDQQPVPVVIDEQEIRRATATYTIDTLQALRRTLGNDVSIVFLMGADQLQHLEKEIRSTPHGKAYLASTLEVDISSTEIRSMLQRGERPESLIPTRVLDYIEQHHLYHK